MKYIDYHNNEKSFRSLTLLRVEQFEKLLPYFKKSHNEYFASYDMNGKYRNHRRRFILYKNSLLPEYHAACFDMPQKYCNRFIPVLYRILFVKRVFNTGVVLHNFRIKIAPWYYQI